MAGVNKLHPLVATAAVAVIVLSAAGVAAFTGLLPGSKGATEPSAAPTTPASASTVAARKANPVHEIAHHAAARKRVKHSARRAEPAAKRTQVAVAKPPCPDCGVVEAVHEVSIRGKDTGVGAVAGGVIGAVAGHQIGGGRGKTLMSVIGAVGGAIAGNEIEKKQKTTKQWRVTVRLESGREQVVTLAQQPPWRAGDHVRLVNGTIESAPRS